MIYLSINQVIEIHDSLVEEFGGVHGVRDKGLLESALASPMISVFGEEPHKSVYEKAAAYLFHIIQNHPFVDGNKRTATACALIFLRANGENPVYDTKAFLKFVISIAEGKTDINQILKFLLGIARCQE